MFGLWNQNFFKGFLGRTEMTSEGPWNIRKEGRATDMVDVLQNMLFY